MCTYLSRGAKIGKPFKPQGLTQNQLLRFKAVTFKFKFQTDISTYFLQKKNLTGAPAIHAQVMRNMFSPQNVITVCLHPFSFCYGLISICRCFSISKGSKRKSSFVFWWQVNLLLFQNLQIEICLFNIHWSFFFLKNEKKKVFSFFDTKNFLVFVIHGQFSQSS